MSGHSKWSTIKRAKGAADAKKGKLFSKLSKNIAVAVKVGGSADPNFNFKLRMAIEKAKEAAMPADNIERAVSRGSGAGKEAIQSVVYEGYGPSKSAIIVEAVTDNKNRTTQNIRNIFNKHQGRMGEQGSVIWMFKPVGLILLEKQEGTDNLPLELIDLGVEDVIENEQGLEIYTNPNDLEKIKKFLENKHLKILSADSTLKPEQEVQSADPGIMSLINALEDDEDVLNVYTNTNLTSNS